MQIPTNSTSLVAIKAIYSANKAVAQASERISTGLRINRASDDPAGLLVANRLSVRVASYSKASDNLSMAAAVTQVVDDSLAQIQQLLASMRTLAVSSSSGSYGTTAMAANQDQMDEYVDAIDSIASNATWNGQSLLDGSTTTLTFQSGIDAGDSLAVSFSAMTSTSLTLGSLDVETSVATASAAISTIDTAITAVSSFQSTIGAKQNVVEAHSQVMDSHAMNHSIAYGRIMEADLAQETAQLASAQIQRDAATAMLAQSSTMNREIVNFLLKSSLN